VPLRIKRRKRMKTSIKKGTLAKILKEKYFPERSKKECQIIARFLVDSDFKLNDITTYGQAFRFLDYVQGLRKVV